MIFSFNAIKLAGYGDGWWGCVQNYCKLILKPQFQLVRNLRNLKNLPPLNICNWQIQTHPLSLADKERAAIRVQFPREKSLPKIYYKTHAHTHNQGLRNWQNEIVIATLPFLLPSKATFYPTHKSYSMASFQ